MRNIVLWIVGFILFLLLILLIWYIINVINDNRPPLAVDDEFTTPYVTAVSDSVLTNDSDPDQDVLTVTVPQISGPSNGMLQLDPAGTFRYEPNPGFSGSDDFTYEVCDPDNECDQAVVTIDVGVPPIDTVMANDDSAATMMNTAVPINVLANDQGAIVTVATTNAAAAVQADNSVVYTPAISATGVMTFTYNACNASADCDSATVSVTVWDFQLLNDRYRTPKNTAVSGNVRDNDLGNPTISSTPAVAPMHGTLVLQADGQFTYTPNTDRLGDDTFSYQGCNAAGDCGTAVVNITVGGPRPEPDNFTTIMNRPLTENVLLNDEGTGLQASETLVTVPISGTAVLQSDGTFTYTPDPDFTGSDKFTYQVCDSDNLCADEIVTILVKEIPDTANHTVVSGEWLLQIARCYGTTVQTIRQHNSIPYPDRIFPGQVLDIREIGSAGPYLGPPCIQSHTVAAGETITSIAEMYGITASELARVNGLYTYYYYGYGYYYYYYSYRPIFVGQKLVVPRPIPDYMQPRP